jgi:hypothetical protein
MVTVFLNGPYPGSRTLEMHTVPRVGERVTYLSPPEVGLTMSGVVVAVEHDATGAAPSVTVFLEHRKRRLW